MTMTRKKLILNALGTAVANFLYYDRKDDEDLPLNDIEAAIAAGEITAEEIIENFRTELKEGLE
jgi:hypothetical protein